MLKFSILRVPTNFLLHSEEDILCVLHGKVSVTQPCIPGVPSCHSSACGMHPAVALISNPGIQLQTLVHLKTREDEPSSLSPVLQLTMLLSPRQDHLSTSPSCCSNEGCGQLRALSHLTSSTQFTELPANLPHFCGRLAGLEAALTRVNGRVSGSRTPSQSLHDSHREGNCRKSALFMAPQCFKEERKRVFFTTTAADVNRSCRCSDFLRGQTLEPNVMNIMVCLLLLCCLVDSAALSCTAEQRPSLWNLSPPLTGDVSDMNPLTLHHC